jgi:hypothetical protein
MKRKLKFDNLDLLFRRLKKRRISYNDSEIKLKNDLYELHNYLKIFKFIFFCLFFFQRFKLFF